MLFSNNIFYSEYLYDFCQMYEPTCLSSKLKENSCFDLLEHTTIIYDKTKIFFRKHLFSSLPRIRFERHFLFACLLASYFCSVGFLLIFYCFSEIEALA